MIRDIVRALYRRCICTRSLIDFLPDTVQ